jgi:hypothetical protein
LAATLGKTTARTKSLLPSVRLRANGGFDVRLFEQTAADGIGEMLFSFDRNGILRSLTKETRTKAEMLEWANTGPSSANLTRYNAVGLYLDSCSQAPSGAGVAGRGPSHGRTRRVSATPNGL